MGNATKFHPLTGALLVPLGYRKNGRAIWPIMGASDDPPPADAPPADKPPAPADKPPADPGKTPPWGDPENFNAEKAWELIQNLRTEKGDPAKVAELETKLAEVQSAQQAQMDAIAKALGLKQDDTPDPEALTKQVQAEQAKARDAALQLAVFKSAGALEANAARLLDSASFLASLKDIDPGDAEAIGKAITAAVEADEMFKASPTPTTPPFPGGPRTPASPRAGSLGEAIAAKLAATRSS